MIVGIIGLGLIGGSMAIDLKRRGFARIVLGVEADPVNAAAAERMELVDEIVPFEECVRRSDITVIAIPVGSAVKMLPQVLDIFKEEGNGKKIVIDTCSTKSNIVRAAHYHPLRCRFVATHPMATTSTRRQSVSITLSACSTHSRTRSFLNIGSRPARRPSSSR